MKHEETSRAFFRVLRKARQTDLNCLHPGLSQSEYFVLLVARRACVGENIEQEIYVSALVERLKVSPQAVSKLLRSLEKKCYIERVVDNDDRRNVFVRLTETGVAALQLAEQSLMHFANRVIADMGEENMDMLLTLLNELYGVIDKELSASTMEDGNLAFLQQQNLSAQQQ